MKKLFLVIFIFVFFLLFAATIVLQIKWSGEKQAKMEVAALAQEVTLIHEMLAKRKQIQNDALALSDAEMNKIKEASDKIAALDAELELEMKSVEKEILETPILIAKLTVLPKFAELLYAMGHKMKANLFLTESIPLIKNVEDQEVRAAVYVTYAECALRCRDFELHEKCRAKAEALIEASPNLKWKGTMEKTLRDLTLLKDSIQSMPNTFMPAPIQEKAPELPFTPSQPKDEFADEKNEKLQENLKIETEEQAVPLTLDDAAVGNETPSEQKVPAPAEATPETPAQAPANTAETPVQAE